MKLALIIITVLICIPGIAQDEKNNNLETNNGIRTALCKTKLTGDAEVRNIWDDVITVLPKDTKVKVFTTEEGYWFIKTADVEGYISEKYLKVTNKMERVRNDNLTQDNGKIEDDKFKGNQIWLGMSKATVRETIGEPNAINHFEYPRGQYSELWKYNGQSLYFENGVLVKRIY